MLRLFDASVYLTVTARRHST